MTLHAATQFHNVGDESTCDVSYYFHRTLDHSVCGVCAKAAGWGYDGFRIGLLGRPFRYQQSLRALPIVMAPAVLTNNNLQCWAISAHIIGQMVLDITMRSMLGACRQAAYEEKAAGDWQMKEAR